MKLNIDTSHRTRTDIYICVRLYPFIHTCIHQFVRSEIGDPKTHCVLRWQRHAEAGAGRLRPRLLFIAPGCASCALEDHVDTF